MKYLSLCSGIEAATVAWHPLGWEAVAYSEIERFPSEVLAHHYPNTPNLGDMTKFKEWTNVSDVDVLVGGTPCQSFSVAGLRKGLDDPRGNLMLTYLAIAKRYRPNWLVWENVPGVLSSNGGRDFGSFLGGLAECGYGFAYRVLDAQFFGVAQRRRRVFVVGYLGDWRLAAAVLFERHSLQGHPAPSREKRQGVTGSVRKGVDVSDYDVAGTLDKGIPGRGIGHNGNYDSQVVSRFIGISSSGDPDLMNTLCATDAEKWGSNEWVKEGKAVLQPIALAENTIGRQPHNGGNGDGFTDGGPMYTLNATGVHGVAQPIAYAFDSLSSNSMKSANPASGCNEVDVSKALDTSRGLDPSCNQGGIGVAQPIAYNISPGKGALKEDIHVTDADATKTLDASASNPAMHQGGTAIVQSVVAPTLTAANDPSRSPQSSEVTQQVYSVYQSSMAVRRLTPIECERLQGFPDSYTDIKSKNKPTPDGPRYKALGNSMAVPVMAWIGQRIQEVEAICKQNK
jgi:DNA (cytosine-5)-methyltransferase 1